MFPNDLKKSIIQYAIEGKLVEQDINEGSAKALIEDIIKTKEKLIKDKVIKKDKFNSYIYRDNNRFFEESDNGIKDITDQLPFDIPESWEWVRLGNVFINKGGYAFKPRDYREKGTRIIRISDFDEYGLIEKNPVFCEINEKNKKYIIPKHSIVVCMTGGTVGKSTIINDDNLLLNQRVANIINMFSKPWLIDFLNFFLKSNYIKNLIKSNMTSTNDNISSEFINNILIPFPPLNEQKRIVEKIEEIFNTIDKIQE